MVKMPRSVKEWIGDNDDQMPPASVFNRLWHKQDGKCPECTRQLTAGNVTRDHKKPIIFGGDNRETNLQLICTDPCSLKKSGEENSRKCKADRVLNKTMGFKSPSQENWSRPVPGSKNSNLASRYNKHTGRWETVLREQGT